MTREEHLEWAKRRALEYVDRGDLEEAFASLGTDFDKHPDLKGAVRIHVELGMPMLLGGMLDRPDDMIRFINGFH